jgi:hypothetical protein
MQGDKVELSFQPLMRVRRYFPHRPWHKLLCAVIVAAIGYGPIAWITIQDSTTSFKPVDMPARVTPGAMHAGPFRINRHGLYLIEYSAAWTASRDSFPPADVQWSLSRNGKAFAAGGATPWRTSYVSQDEYGAEIGSFEIATDEPADYQLDVSLKTDLSALRKAAPRLLVEIHPHEIKGRGLFELIAAMAATPIILVFLIAAIWQWGADVREARRWRKNG